MAFNNLKINTVKKIFEITEEEAEELLKHQAKYLKTNPAKLLNSYSAVVKRILEEAEERKAKEKKYNSKNLLILKYKEEIIDLYKQGFGYLKISKAMDINHKAKISKSAIENFIKKNNITRN